MNLKKYLMLILSMVLWLELVSLVQAQPRTLTAGDACTAAAGSSVDAGTPFTLAWTMPAGERVNGFYLQIDSSPKADIGLPTPGTPCATGTPSAGSTPFIYSMLGLPKGPHSIRVTAWNFVRAADGTPTTQRSDESGSGITTFDAIDPTQPPPLPPPANFAIGNRIQAGPQGILARDQPSTTASFGPAHLPGDLGTITGGPTVADGYTWWTIDYDTGHDGWSTEGFFVLAPAQPPPPPPPPPPPSGSVTVTGSIASCRYVLTSQPPDASGGWGVQFRRGTVTFVNVGTRDTSAPFTRTSAALPISTLIPGYSFSAVWTKTGVPTVIDPVTPLMTCDQ